MPSRASITALTLVLATSAASESVLAQELPFRTGRFLADDDREVFNGTFDRGLRIDSLTVGEGMFRASRNELLPAAAIRVLVDESGLGRWRAMSERELLSGMGPVRFAYGSRPGLSTLDAFTARHLDRMFFSDGSANVRIDLLLPTGIYDSSAGRSDSTPEVILAGNLRGNARLGAIIGGNVDDPILSRRMHQLDTGMLQRSETGIAIMVNQQAASVGMVGLDLSSAFDVQSNIPAIGYRLELERGASGYFTMFGAGSAEQLAGNEPSLIEEREEGSDELLGLSSGGGGGGGAGGSGAPVYGGGRGTMQIDGVRANPSQRIGSQAPFRGSGSLGGGLDFDLEEYLDFLRRLRQQRNEEQPVAEEPPADDGDDDAGEGDDKGSGSDDPPPTRGSGGDDDGSKGTGGGPTDGSDDSTRTHRPDIDSIDLNGLIDNGPRAPLGAGSTGQPFGGSIGGGNGGEGDPVVPASIPAPGAMMLLALAAIGTNRRTRRQV